MFKVLPEKNKVFFGILGVLGAFFVCFWGVKCYQVNARAYRQETEYYTMGDMVELDGNFFFDTNEKTEGYSVKVNAMELVDYADLFHEYDREVSLPDNYPIAENAVLLNVTVKNTGNTDGYLPINGFAIYYGALQLPIDFEILNMIDPQIDGSTVLRLKTDSEVTLTLPFSPMPLDEAINSKKLNDVLKNEELFLCVCEFPTRKNIILRKEK